MGYVPGSCGTMVPRLTWLPPTYIHQHKLKVCPIEDLDHSLNRFGDLLCREPHSNDRPLRPPLSQFRNIDEKVLLTDKCMIQEFQTNVVHGRMQETMMLEHQLNVMTQVLYLEDKADLPNRLYVHYQSLH